MSKNINGRMCLPGLSGFTLLGAMLSPAACAFDPDVGFGVALITGIFAAVVYFTSYTLTIRIPTAEEIEEFFDDERD